MAYQLLKFERMYASKVSQIAIKYDLKAYLDHQDDSHYYITFRGDHAGIRAIVAATQKNHTIVTKTKSRWYS